MPFIKYGNINHQCHQPSSRADGTPLQTGDEWQCDTELQDQPNVTPIRKCGKIWRWSYSNDQREPDNYWRQIIEGR